MIFNTCSTAKKMVHEFLAWELLLLQNRVRNMKRRLQRREWRNNHDPFELSEDMFIDLHI